MRADGLGRARATGMTYKLLPLSRHDVVNTRRLIAQTNDGRFGVNRFRPDEPLLPQHESFFRSRDRTPRGPIERLSLKYHGSHQL